MGIRTVKDAEINTDTLQKHLQDYSRLMGKEMGAVIQNQAALFLKDMCKYSPPFANNSPGTGLESGARTMQQNIIKYQIESIFKPLDKANPSQVAALGSETVFRQWVTFIKSSSDDQYLVGNIRHFHWTTFHDKFTLSQHGNKIITTMSDMERTHTGLRYKGYGNIKKSISGTRGSGSNFKANFIVEKPSLIKQFISKKQKNVGTQKSPYFFSAQHIGDKKVTFPAWVSNHRDLGLSYAINELSHGVVPSVTVGSKIGMVVDPKYKFVLNLRMAKMRRQMVAFMRSKKITLCDAILAGKIYGTAPLFSDD
jgi:hypothetical protein